MAGGIQGEHVVNTRKQDTQAMLWRAVRLGLATIVAAIDKVYPPVVTVPDPIRPADEDDR
jgi:hypothetical protein